MPEYHVQQNSAEEQETIRQFVVWAMAITFGGAALLIVFILAARLWLPLIPFESEKRFADRYVAFFVGEETDGDEPDSPRRAYVTELATAIVEDMDLPADYVVTVHFVESADQNAFATLGGHVFVFSGLLSALETENALAMVIAHEIAHVAHRDPLVGVGRALMLSLLFFSVTGQGAPTDVVDIGSELALLTYSRDQEREADLVAIETLAKRYGHVGGATAFFEHVIETVDDEQTEGSALMSSHPQLRERIDYLDEHAAAAGWTKGEEIPIPPGMR